MPTGGSPAEHIEPIRSELAQRIAQAVCGDDHLMCSWPDCQCKNTKQKINAVAAVVGAEIAAIKDCVRNALENPAPQT